jgi:hypothetical protein
LGVFLCDHAEKNILNKLAYLHYLPLELVTVQKVMYLSSLETAVKESSPY